MRDIDCLGSDWDSDWFVRIPITIPIDLSGLRLRFRLMDQETRVPIGIPIRIWINIAYFRNSGDRDRDRKDKSILPPLTAKTLFYPHKFMTEFE